MATRRMPPPELLDHLASADVDALRTILQHPLQALIEAEATAYIGPPLASTRPNGAPTATGIAPGRSIRAWGGWSCRSPSCGRAAASRACWSHADASSAPCWP